MRSAATLGRAVAAPARGPPGARRPAAPARAAAGGAARALTEAETEALLESLRSTYADADVSAAPTVDVGPLLGGRMGAEAVSLRDAIQAAAEDARPRFASLVSPSAPPSPSRAALPRLLCRPGIEGTGITISRQLPGLLQLFDLQAMLLPPGDRTSFRELVRLTAEHLRAEAAGRDPLAPVYLMGESFGGLLAAAVAAECPDVVGRVVLVNPATSFERTPWASLGPVLSALPPPLYGALPFALAPVLGNSLSMAAARTSLRSVGLAGALSGALGDPARAAGQLSELAAALAEMIPSLSGLNELLQPATLAYRIKLLEQGSAYVRGRLSRVQQRTLVVCGGDDALLPSAAEGP